MNWQRLIGIGFLILCLCEGAEAKSIWQGGFRLGFMHPHTELIDKTGSNGYGFIRWGFHRAWLIEFGGGYGRLEGRDYSTDFWMGETKMVWEMPSGKWIHPVVLGDWALANTAYITCPRCLPTIRIHRAGL